MPLYESLLRPLLFRTDPEFIHELVTKCISLGLVRASAPKDPRLERTAFGVRFPNPIGLAAGFDKNGVALRHLAGLGFGFAEIGTVTRHAQPGNPKPRLFRMPEHHAIVNRMGFNNDGADAMARRIAGVKAGIPVGINLGKSKVTPLEDAPEDYAYSFRLLREFGDYFVVNVSSPNTPGLRTLQEREPLARIFGALKQVDETKPLLVKVAPDLTEPQLDEVLEVAREYRLSGIVATNTTISREMLPADPGIEGGLSGGPLKEMARKALRHLAANTPPEMTLIGVGGIETGHDALERLADGAQLVQVYTGWIYAGPGGIPKMLREMLAEMDAPR